MSISSQIIEYPDSLTNLTCRVIAKVPNAILSWKILALLWILTLCFIIIRYAHKSESSSRYIYSYLTLGSIGIIGFRLPDLVLPMLNYDEADWVVYAATLWKKPIFWRDVDATTSGPLNIYPLLIIKILGGKINYFTLRLFSLLFCCIPTFIFSFQVLKKYATPLISTVLTAPLAVAFATLNETDLVSFDSTYIPMVVIAFAYQLLLSIEYIKYKVPAAMALAFILGLLPFFKLQTVPVGIGLGLWLLYKAHFLWRLPIRSIFYILISSLVPSILVGICVFALNIQTDFWESYVRNNLLYAEVGVVGQEKDWWFKVRVPLYLISVSPTISSFFYSFGAISLVSSLYCFINFTRMQLKNKIDLVGSIVVFSLSYYSISQPGNICHYYLILLIVPLFFLTSISFLNARKLFDSHEWNYQIVMYILFLSATIGLQGFVNIGNGSLGVKIINEGYRGMGSTPLIEEMKKFVKPNDYIAVLGCRSDIYVFTNTLLGIRESQTVRMHFPFKNQQVDYYQNRIASDIITNKPKLVIDAALNSNISYPYNDSTTMYENYSIVQQAIDSNYSYYATVDKIRILVRK